MRCPGIQFDSEIRPVVLLEGVAGSKCFSELAIGDVWRSNRCWGRLFTLSTSGVITCRSLLTRRVEALRWASGLHNGFYLEYE